MVNAERQLQKSFAQGMIPLRLVEAQRRGLRAMETVIAKDGAPWHEYTKIYSLKLGEHEPVIVAEETSGPSYGLATIYQSRNLSEHQLEMLSCIQHQNFVTVHQIYQDKDSCFIVAEHIARSLQEAVGNPFLDSAKVAAIIGQITSAMVFLEDQGLRLGSLTCSDVLLHPNGTVKLRGQQNCVRSDSKETIRRLGIVMMELMDGYVKDNGSIGLDNPERWSDETLPFLSATASVSSARELLKHPFLLSWQRRELQGLISFVAEWTKQSYCFLGNRRLSRES